MIKFIELRNTLNLPTAINVEEIQGIVEDKECTNISLKGDGQYYSVKETVSEILTKIYGISNNLNN